MEARYMDLLWTIAVALVADEEAVTGAAVGCAVGFIVGIGVGFAVGVAVGFEVVGCTICFPRSISRTRAITKASIEGTCNWIDQL
jgi:predicted DNA repair protein MutK